MFLKKTTCQEIISQKMSDSFDKNALLKNNVVNKETKSLAQVSRKHK